MLRRAEGVLEPAPAEAMLDTIDQIRATLSGLQGLKKEIPALQKH
jgi:hypothetical protein